MSLRKNISDFLFENEEESSEIPMPFIDDIRTPIESSEISISKKCTNCGTQIIHDTSLFCDNCGSKLSTYQQGSTQSAITPAIKIQPFVDDIRTPIESSENKVNTKTDHGNDPCTTLAIFYFLISAFCFVLYIFSFNSSDLLFALVWLGGGLYVFSNRQSPKDCANSKILFWILSGVILLLVPILYWATDPTSKLIFIFFGLISLVRGVIGFIAIRGGL